MGFFLSQANEFQQTDQPILPQENQGSPDVYENEVPFQLQSENRPPYPDGVITRLLGLHRECERVE